MDDEIGGVPRLRGDGRPERDRNATDAVEGGEENCEGLRRGARSALHSGGNFHTDLFIAACQSRLRLDFRLPELNRRDPAHFHCHI